MNISRLGDEVIKDIITHNQDGIVVIDSGQQIIYANMSFLNSHSFTFNQIEGRSPAIFMGVDEYIKMLDSTRHGKWEGDIKTISSNGTSVYSHISLTEVIHQSGSITNTLIVRDNSRAKAYESALWNMAMRDPLTDLYNRRYFMEQMKYQVSSNSRAKRYTGIILIDLDNFSNINNTLGHDAGDQVLVMMAGRLKGAFNRDSDLVARLGGDEFVILINELDGDNPEKDADNICKRLISALDNPYTIDGKLLEFTGSVGMAICNASTCDKLLLEADNAMYESKAKGKNTYSIVKLLK